jgi:hypothetical protein
MPGHVDANTILSDLRAKVQGLGVAVKDVGPGAFMGEATNILVKWALGRRKVRYKMSCCADEASRTVHFREVVTERSWGLLPPTLTVETTGLKGWERSGTRSEKTVRAGGGKVDYGQVREAIKAAVEAAGWRFDLEGGHLP